MTKHKRRLSKKKKGLSTNPKYTMNPGKAPRKLKNKEKAKLSKTLWESTQMIDPKDIPEISEDDGNSEFEDDSEMEEDIKTDSKN